MIPISLSQTIETLPGAPAAAPDPANSASFSSLLADAAAAATDMPQDDGAALTAQPANAASPALAATSASATPLLDTAAPALMPEDASAPRDDAGHDQPRLEITQAAVSAITLGIAGAPSQQQPAGVLQVDDANRARNSRPGHVAGRAAATKVDALDSSVPISEAPGKEQADPAALTMQQALAAVASLSVASGAPQQPTASAKTSPAPALSSNTAPSARAAPSPARTDGTPLHDSKLAPAPVSTLTTVQSNSLAMLLEQRGPATTQVRSAQGPSAPVAASQLADLSSHAHSYDLHQLDALVRDIAEVSGTTGRAAMRLTADQLGPLEIRLHRSDAGMTITIRTETEQSHSTVVQAQQQLSDDMRANGVKLAATSVMLGHGGSEAERQNRQPLPFAPPIEAAASDADQSETCDEQRPAGRYA